METGVYALEYKGYFFVGIFTFCGRKKKYSKPFARVISEAAAAAVVIYLQDGLKAKGLI